MTARHGCGQGLLRCNGTYRGDGNGYPLLFCCATEHQVCYVWHPQSPSLAEEAFAGSINGDCEYLQMQGHFRRISAPCMLKIRHYGFLSNPQKKIRLKLARRLTRTKAPMPSDSKLSARELMLRVSGIDICRCRQCGGNLTSYIISALPRRATIQSISRSAPQNDRLFSVGRGILRTSGSLTTDRESTQHHFRKKLFTLRKNKLLLMQP